MLIRQLGRQPYAPTVQAMRGFTEGRSADTPDEIWLVEHDPVYTQGLAGKPEHLLDPGAIPVVASNRGGQVIVQPALGSLGEAGYRRKAKADGENKEPSIPTEKGFPHSELETAFEVAFGVIIEGFGKYAGDAS